MGEYSFNDMQVICQPMNLYPVQVEALKENLLDNVVIGGNTFTGSITLSSDELLCLTIPYSNGWKAYMYGEEKELLRTNTIWGGVFLEEGKHEIELRYTTPGIKYGIIFSAVGIVIFVILVFVILIVNDRLRNRVVS